MARYRPRSAWRIRRPPNPRRSLRPDDFGHARCRTDFLARRADRRSLTGQADVLGRSLCRTGGSAGPPIRPPAARRHRRHRPVFHRLAELVDQSPARLCPRRQRRQKGRSANRRRTAIIGTGPCAEPDAREAGRQAIRRTLRAKSGARDEKPAHCGHRRGRNP